MRINISVLLPALLGFAFSVSYNGACTSYEPTLGESPFRCGDASPACPKGYACTEQGGDNICLRFDLLDGNGEPEPEPEPPPLPPFTCANDKQLEPNDTLSNPTEVPIPADTDFYSLEGLSICPESDVDVFHFSTVEEGRTISVTLKLRADRGELALDVLDDTGVSIRQGVPENGNEEILVATIEDAPIGTYYAQVRGVSSETVNNYGIEISAVPPASP